MQLTVLEGSKGRPSGGCSGRGDGPLPADLAARVRDHPCYSEEAHHTHARMHLAVAPACNIQCNYCNRKYDCANESRPGVVSELLTPEQALRKLRAVAVRVPKLSVLGIAGPGDPLANPRRTFETFRRVAAEFPGLRLCMSTNGLALPDHVDELVALGVDHVTITMNALDPELGARIYPWIFWNHRRLRGRKAAEVLIDRQRRGLEMLVERGVLVKINSVMIPGVNDRHLREVSAFVRERGAFLHNVVPLIAEAEHGTHYGLAGQRGPTPEELAALRDACGGDMRMMRHCRQCRADAVGLLGEDLGQEFTLEAIAGTEAAPDDGDEIDRSTAPARIAVATATGEEVDLDLGHAPRFRIYEVGPRAVRLLEIREMRRACGGADCRDRDGVSIHDDLTAVLDGCAAVLAARIGFGAWRHLESAGLLPSGDQADRPVVPALRAVYRELVEAGRLDDPPAAVSRSAG